MSELAAEGERLGIDLTAPDAVALIAAALAREAEPVPFGERLVYLWDCPAKHHAQHRVVYQSPNVPTRSPGPFHLVRILDEPHRTSYLDGFARAEELHLDLTKR